MKKAIIRANFAYSVLPFSDRVITLGRKGQKGVGVVLWWTFGPFIIWKGRETERGEKSVPMVKRSEETWAESKVS